MDVDDGKTVIKEKESRQVKRIHPSVNSGFILSLENTLDLTEAF